MRNKTATTVTGIFVVAVILLFGMASFFGLNLLVTTQQADALAQIVIIKGKGHVEPEGGPTETYKLTHGFELHCNPEVTPNHLQLNFPAFGHTMTFTLDRLDNAFCNDNFLLPNSPPNTPVIPEDTYTGSGKGRLFQTHTKINGDDGCGAYAFWTFTDGDLGTDQKGKNDRMVNLAIYDNSGELIVRWDGSVFYDKGTDHQTFPGYFLQTGNHQFLPEPNHITQSHVEPCSPDSLGDHVWSLTPPDFTGSIPGVY